LMDYIHTWLNKWRMQGISPKQVMVFHPKEGERAGEGPPERLDTGGIAIDHASKYQAYQEDGSWQAHTKGACKEQPMGTGGHCCHAAVCRQRSDCSWFRPLIPRSCMARKWDTTKAVKDKMSAVVKKAPQHSSPASPRLLF
jgi:hypothetical protein